ncbi:3'-5' exonuclease domain-containing protein [Hibiscus syriacus]|uniref:3'-5' exonuclease domain-containing protein n=1 Tax=Hibiscus syriacus TaxID=106335 RepID=A0A6A3A7M1_HIBSY|nr:3'-5' exonuclease domain-containing protein [Hibiscus syriacus]
MLIGSATIYCSSEFQMVMNVLWTRLGETGKDWRYIYKALTVIEYLISHGSERAVDDIIEHTFQISVRPEPLCFSSLTSFEYVEASGKDMGINVRKKAETIVGLLSNKEKIQEARNKAAENRDKYIGLLSRGITYKSGGSSYDSGGLHGDGDSYGGLSSRRESDSYTGSYKESNRYGEEKSNTDAYVKSHRGTSSEKHRNHDSAVNPFILAVGSSNQVDLFGRSLIDDLFDGPASILEKSAMNTDSMDVDLFADATFVSATTKLVHESSPQQHICFITPAASPSDPVVQPDTKVAEYEPMSTSTVNPFVAAPLEVMVDLFASLPASTPAAASPTVYFFSNADPVVQLAMAANIEPVNADIVDPFAAVPLKIFDGSEIFGSLTTHIDSASKALKQSPTNDGNLNNISKKSSLDSKAPQKDGFQVKSGIWADSLSRGIIDLSISAPNKVSLADVGTVGGLSDVDERERGPPPSFSNLGSSQQYQFGSYK